MTKIELMALAAEAEAEFHSVKARAEAMVAEAQAKLKEAKLAVPGIVSWLKKLWAKLTGK